jgi:hypothetical protein
MFRLLQPSFRHRARRHARRRPANCVSLSVQQLEDRTVPTTFTWVGGAVGAPNDWATPAN